MQSLHRVAKSHSSDGTGGITTGDLSTQSIIGAFSICHIPTRSPARDDGDSRQPTTDSRKPSRQPVFFSELVNQWTSRSLQVSDLLIKKERFYRSFLIRFVLPTCYKLKEFNYPIVYCHVYCIILLDSITYDFGSHGVLRMGTIISKKHGDRKYYYYV